MTNQVDSDIEAYIGKLQIKEMIYIHMYKIRHLVEKNLKIGDGPKAHIL